MPLLVVPLSHIICAVWLYLATKTVHLVGFELALIQEAKAIELCTESMPSTIQVSLAFVFGLVVESDSWSLSGYCIVGIGLFIIF